MFVVSFIANMLKRHPRCMRLIHRPKKIFKSARLFQSDPYLASQPDPSKAKALKSSLWEIESLMKSDLDEQVRNYSKLFKGDISRKSAYFKSEEFAGMDPIQSILTDMDKVDIALETKAVTKAVLIEHKQWQSAKEEGPTEEEMEPMDLNPSNYKQMKMAERYTHESEFFDN